MRASVVLLAWRRVPYRQLWDSSDRLLFLGVVRRVFRLRCSLLVSPFVERGCWGWCGGACLLNSFGTLQTALFAVGCWLKGVLALFSVVVNLLVEAVVKAPVCSVGVVAHVC